MPMFVFVRFGYRPSLSSDIRQLPLHPRYRIPELWFGYIYDLPTIRCYLSKIQVPDRKQPNEL
ncbi:hypothetical protein HanRHA438_Chr01g0002781 [Helianthus annuus]|nr:hypothetical protein HanRHA438_Chr01g0002781 [Helianthus annuus]